MQQIKSNHSEKLNETKKFSAHPGVFSTANYPLCKVTNTREDLDKFKSHNSVFTNQRLQQMGDSKWPTANGRQQMADNKWPTANG